MGSFRSFDRSVPGSYLDNRDTLVGGKETVGEKGETMSIAQVDAEWLSMIPQTDYRVWFAIWIS